MALSTINLARGISDWWTRAGGVQAAINETRQFANTLEAEIDQLVVGAITNELAFSSNTQTASDHASVSAMANLQSLAMTAASKNYSLLDVTATGYAGLLIIVKNTGSYSFGVRDYSGGFIINSLAPAQTAILQLMSIATAAGTWQAVTLPANTVLTSLATNDFLQYDGTNFVNKTRDNVINQLNRASADDSNDRTFALTDAQDYLRYTGTGGHTWTIPANASVAFALRTEIECFNATAFELTLEADTGVTVNGVTAGSVIIPPYAAFCIKKAATNTWDYIGINAEAWA